MFYVGAKIISKAVGKSYEIEWNRENFTVQIIKGKKKTVFTFDKFCESVDFFASLDTVKAIKQAVLLARFLYGIK